MIQEHGNGKADNEDGTLEMVELKDGRTQNPSNTGLCARNSNIRKKGIGVVAQCIKLLLLMLASQETRTPFRIRSREAGTQTGILKKDAGVTRSSLTHCTPMPIPV